MVSISSRSSGQDLRCLTAARKEGAGEGSRWCAPSALHHFAACRVLLATPKISDVRSDECASDRFIAASAEGESGRDGARDGKTRQTSVTEGPGVAGPMARKSNLEILSSRFSSSSLICSETSREQERYLSVDYWQYMFRLCFECAWNKTIQKHSVTAAALECPRNWHHGKTWMWHF